MPKKYMDVEKRAYWQGVGVGRLGLGFKGPNVSAFLKSFPDGAVRESAFQGVLKGGKKRLK